MPKTQSKNKPERTPNEGIAISLEDLKPRETKPTVTFITNKPNETKAEKIRAALDEMKTKDDIVGFILQNSKSASIDLNDPEKIIQYALLSSSAKEISLELAQTFNLGKIENVLTEGEDIKLLQLTVDENEVSIFMKKSHDHAEICKNLTELT